jgi:hypothetical protein
MKCTWLALLTCIKVGCAQSSFPAIAPAYTAINAYSPRFADAFSVIANQALLPALQMPVAGVYGEQRFMLKELRICAAAIAWPLDKAGVGIAMHYSGVQAFNSSAIGVSYGRQLHEKLSIGIQFNYITVQAAGYGSSSIGDVEIGMIYRVADKLYAGLHAYNPVAGKLGITFPEHAIAVFKLGLGYEPGDKIFTSFEIEKQQGSPAGINAGMQYIFGKQLIARMSIETTNRCYTVGFGWQWKNFRTDIISSFHPQLGITPALMLLFCFKETTNEEQP